jgi:hypothetical protein
MEGTNGLMRMAETRTRVYLEMMRRQVSFGLGFAALTVLVNLINFMAMVMTRHFRVPGEMVAVIAPHVVLIPMSIMVIVHIIHLRKVREELIFLGHGPSHPDGPRTGPMSRSLTDIHYDVVSEMSRAIKLWIPTAIIFVIFFNWGIMVLVGWLFLGMFPNITLDPLSILNIFVYGAAVVYFYMQTRIVMRWSRKISNLEEMERRIKEELDL